MTENYIRGWIFGFVLLFVLSYEASAATVTFLTAANRSPQTITISSITVPTGLTTFKFSIARANWTNVNAILTITIDVSFDSGVTWQNWGGFKSHGGTVVNQDNGLTATESYITAQIGQPTNAGRRVRGTIVISGASINASGTLTMN